MSLTPLLETHPIIQIHAYAAIAAFLLGAFVLFRRKGDASHKRLGKIWVGFMAAAGLTSFFIWETRTFGLFSPIHLLSIGTLFALYRAVRLARMRQIAGHRRIMQGLYLGALVIAGIFTFAPGRIMNEVVFGPDGADAGEWAVFALCILSLLGLILGISRYRPTRAQNALSSPRT